MKMLFNLDKIPKRLKNSRSREKMPQIILKHYGLKASICEIQKVMDLIPRKDLNVQDLLRPFVDKLKKKHQTKNKDEKESCKLDKIKTIRDVKSSSKLLKTEAIFGKVVDISDLRTYKTQDKVEKKFFYLAVADKTDSITVMVYGEERFKRFKKRSCYSFKNVIVDGNTIKVTRLTTVLKIKAFKVPSKVEKDAQTLRKQKPVSPTRKTPVKVKGSDPGKPVKSKQVKTGTKSQETNVKPGTTKVRSDAVQNVKIKITRIIKCLKTKFHLEAEFNSKQQKVAVTSRLLSKATGLKLQDDVEEKLLNLMPISAEAKIQGNKITEMKIM